MADLNTVTCEVCTVLKKEANHWWTAYALKDKHGRPAGILITPDGSAEIAWPFRRKLPKPTAHLCGQAHAQRWMDAQLHQARSSEPWPVTLQITPGQPVVPVRLQITPAQPVAR